MLTTPDYESGKKMQDSNVCADSGQILSLAWGGKWGIDSWILVCADPACATEHAGITELPSHAMTVRADREATAGTTAALNAGRTDRMLPGGPSIGELERSIALIQARYPKADLTHASATLFVMDCWRLSLDPLLGEIVPATFKVTEQGKPTIVVVVPIITEDGYLSLAARACPERWVGPPRLMPIAQAIVREFPDHPDQWEAMTKSLSLSLCRDENAWVWEARGRTGDMPKDVPWDQLNPSYGWMTHEEAQSKASTPAGKMPGNQARVRAIKRWVRENFAEARHNMMELTRDLLQRAEGVTEAEAIIEAEFVEIDAPGENQARALPAGKSTRQPAARAPRKTAPTPPSSGEQPPAPNPRPATTTHPTASEQAQEIADRAANKTATTKTRATAAGAMTNSERLELWQRVIGGAFGMGHDEEYLVVRFKTIAPSIIRDKIEGPLPNDKVPGWATNDMLIAMDKTISDAMAGGKAEALDSAATTTEEGGESTETGVDTDNPPETSGDPAFDALKSASSGADQEAHDHEQSSGALGGEEATGKAEETGGEGQTTIPFD